jgi:hypothetical protein
LTQLPDVPAAPPTAFFRDARGVTFKWVPPPAEVWITAVPGNPAKWYGHWLDRAGRARCEGPYAKGSWAKAAATYALCCARQDAPQGGAS